MLVQFLKRGSVELTSGAAISVPLAEPVPAPVSVSLDSVEIEDTSDIAQYVALLGDKYVDSYESFSSQSPHHQSRETVKVSDVVHPDGSFNINRNRKRHEYKRDKVQNWRFESHAALDVGDDPLFADFDDLTEFDGVEVPALFYEGSGTMGYEGDRTEEIFLSPSNEIILVKTERSNATIAAARVGDGIHGVVQSVDEPVEIEELGRERIENLLATAENGMNYEARKLGVPQVFKKI
tara:strand:+ start:196 stop:906 length:711 start_codon:yes stop_codon:yes gene_type:complete